MKQTWGNLLILLALTLALCSLWALGANHLLGSFVLIVVAFFTVGIGARLRKAPPENWNEFDPEEREMRRREREQRRLEREL